MKKPRWAMAAAAPTVDVIVVALGFVAGAGRQEAEESERR